MFILHGKAAEMIFLRFAPKNRPRPTGKAGRYDQKRRACSPSLHPALRIGTFRFPKHCFSVLSGAHYGFLGIRFSCSYGFPERAQSEPEKYRQVTRASEAQDA